MNETELITGSNPINYSANDWFYMNAQKCGNIDCDQTANAKNECCENKTAVQNLRVSTNNLGSTVTQYNDVKMLYTRELLFTVNILAGLVMICYYIYLNQDVLPDPTAAIQKISSVGSSVVNSATSRISALKGAAK